MQQLLIKKINRTIMDQCLYKIIKKIQEIKITGMKKKIQQNIKKFNKRDNKSIKYKFRIQKPKKIDWNS